MQASSILKNVPKQSIFSLLPQSLEELSEFIEVQLVQPGNVIVESGRKLDRLIVPLSDHLYLSNNAETSNILQKGRTLALKNLLDDSPISYSVTSQNYNRLLTLPRAVFLDYLKRYPSQATYLKLMTGSAGFRTFKNFLMEKSVSQEVIIELSLEFESTLLYKGSNLDGRIILNDNSEVALIPTDPQHYQVADRIPQGAWLGGFSLVGSMKLPYSLKIEQSSTFLALPHTALRKYIKDTFKLESIASDPWARVEKKKDDDFWDLKKTITPIEILEKLPFPMDPESFVYGENDIDAIPKTLFNLLTFLGISGDLSETETLLKSARDHLTLSKLAEILESKDLMTRPFEITQNQRIYAPILTFKGNRLLVVLERLPKGELLCMDAIHGFFRTTYRSILGDEPVQRMALLVDRPPTIEDSTASLQQIGIGLVIQVILQSHRYLYLLALCAIAIFGLNALTPYLSQLLLDEVLRTSDSKTLMMCISGLAVTSLGIIIFEYLKNRIANIFSLEFDQKFSSFLYRRALELTSKDINRIQIGGILNRINESEKIRQFFSTDSINKIINLFSIFVYLAILAFYSPLITLIPIGYIVALYFTQKIFRSRITKFNLDHFNVGTRQNTFINDSISKILAIKAFNSNRRVAIEWDQIVIKSSDASQKAQLETSKAEAAVNILSQTTTIGVIWLSVYLLFSKSANFTAGQLFAITQYVHHIIDPAGSLITFVVNFADLRLSLDKVNDILFPGGKVEPPAGKKHAAMLEGKIRLERVSFRYSENEPWVLKDINLTVYPGQVVALVGKSGSGKTTLANLLAGDFEPSTGKIFFDHYDKTFMDLSYLKSQIGYVRQNNDLFSGSIASNIALKDDSPDPKLLDFAKKYSFSEAFLSELPQGDSTHLAEGGIGLSGGQKQRISIARVLYTHPKILLMDEATSSLDSESESEIVKYIRDLAKDRTTFLIAHRLSTIRDADMIFVLDGGTLVQQGTHNQLIRAEGVYKELFQEQSS